MHLVNTQVDSVILTRKNVCARKKKIENAEKKRNNWLVLLELQVATCLAALVWLVVKALELTMMLKAV
jgi:hypothetical protein